MQRTTTSKRDYLAGCPTVSPRPAIVDRVLPVVTMCIIVLTLSAVATFFLSASATAAPHLQSDPPVIGAAGDISNCANEEDFLTGYLLESVDGPILALGDNAYEVGSLVEYQNCYGPAWGRHFDRTYPVPGNHEYGSQGAEGYYTYYGDRATPLEPGCTRDCKGYYSFNVGDWHIIALNSEIDTRAGSEQEQWLRADLAANPATCTLAYWHRPRFTSGRYYNRTAGHGLFQALYEYGADVVLVAHDHSYERFAPQDPAGTYDPDRGIRQFVVGTGGATLRDFYYIQPNSEARNSETWGILKMTLHPDRYDWEFIPIPGQTFTDSGSSPCITVDSVPPPPEGVTVQSVVATTTAAADADTADAETTAPETTAPETTVAPPNANANPAATATGGEYTIQAGDTLSTIAARFGLDWREIAAANDLDEESILFIGQVIQLPGVEGGRPAPGAADAAATGAPSTGTSTTGTSTAGRADTTPVTGETYVVQAGDTLSLIAERFGLTWQELAEVNGIQNGDLIEVGQELVIPGAAETATGTTTAADAADAPEATGADASETTAETENGRATTAGPTAGDGPTIHTVAGGETVLSIAVKYNVNWRDLLAANDLTEDSLIVIGQELVIP